MGRRPTSPELKEARGNPGKRPAQKRESVRAVQKRIALNRPTWLTDKIARDVWQNLQVSLHFLRESDVHVFARYCQYMADWVSANKEIKASGGMVYETTSAHVENMRRINPAFVVRSRLEDDLVKIEEKLGLTPIDRQRIVVQLAAAAQMPLGDLFEGGGEVGAAEMDGGPSPDAGGIDPIGGLRRLN